MESTRSVEDMMAVERMTAVEMITVGTAAARKRAQEGIGTVASTASAGIDYGMTRRTSVWSSAARLPQ